MYIPVRSRCISMHCSMIAKIYRQHFCFKLICMNLYLLYEMRNWVWRDCKQFSLNKFLFSSANFQSFAPLNDCLNLVTLQLLRHREYNPQFSGSLTAFEWHTCIAENVGNYRFKMLILVMLWEHERQRWDASLYTKKRFATLRAFMYRNASHSWRSCSNNMTKITIQFFNKLGFKHVLYGFDFCDNWCLSTRGESIDFSKVTTFKCFFLFLVWVKLNIVW